MTREMFSQFEEAQAGLRRSIELSSRLVERSDALIRQGRGGRSRPVTPLP